MSQELTFEIEGFDPAPQKERELEASGKIPPGWYRAVVHDIYPDKDNPCWKVEFHITHGPFASRKVFESLWDPNAATDQDKAKKSRDRLALIAKRIGARKDGSPSVSFPSAIGNEVVLNMQAQRERYCEHCQRIAEKGESRTCVACGEKLTWQEVKDGFTNMAYEGVFPLDHEKLTDEVRHQLGITVPRKTSAEAAVPTASGQAAPAQPRPSARMSGRIPAASAAAPATGATGAAGQPQTLQQRLAAATADL